GARDRPHRAAGGAGVAVAAAVGADVDLLARVLGDVHRDGRLVVTQLLVPDLQLDGVRARVLVEVGGAPADHRVALAVRVAEVPLEARRVHVAAVERRAQGVHVTRNARHDVQRAHRADLRRGTRSVGVTTTAAATTVATATAAATAVTTAAATAAAAVRVEV